LLHLLRLLEQGRQVTPSEAAEAANAGETG